MPSDVNVPGLGRTGKGTILAVLIAGAAVGGYLILHKKKTTPATTQQPANQYGYGGYGTYGYRTYGYGNPPGEYFGYGYAPDEGLGEAIPLSDLYGYASEYGYAGGVAGSTTGGAAPTTNAQWTQAALTALTGEGYSATTVLAALGLYLTGGQLNANQEAIVNAAIASEGYPPVSGANGYPPAMNVSTSTGQSGSSGSGTGTSSGPTSGTPAKAGPISNLQATKVGSTTATVSWNATSGATGGYSYIVTNLKTGKASAPKTISGTSVNLTGLTSKTSYNFGVQGLPGGAGDNIHFTTT